jgi:hypothetical protein
MTDHVGRTRLRISCSFLDELIEITDVSLVTSHRDTRDIDIVTPKVHLLLKVRYR